MKRQRNKSFTSKKSYIEQFEWFERKIVDIKHSKAYLRTQGMLTSKNRDFPWLREIRNTLVLNYPNVVVLWSEYM